MNYELQKSQYVVLLLANTLITEAGNCLATVFVSYITEQRAGVYLTMV
jgi:hypothetical protein